MVCLLFLPHTLLHHTPVNVSEFRLLHDWIEILTESGSTVGFAY
jgi:hypothetical protein